jgi:hypothetical protein
MVCIDFRQYWRTILPPSDKMNMDQASDIPRLLLLDNESDSSDQTIVLAGYHVL